MSHDPERLADPCSHVRLPEAGDAWSSKKLPHASPNFPAVPQVTELKGA